MPVGYRSHLVAQFVGCSRPHTIHHAACLALLVFHVQAEQAEIPTTLVGLYK